MVTASTAADRRRSLTGLLTLTTAAFLSVTARLAGGLTHALFWAIAAGYAARLVAPDRTGRAAAAAVVAATVVLNLGFYTFYTYVAPYLRHVGLSEAAIGPALLLYGIGNGVGLGLAGAVVDRRPRSSILTSTSALIVAMAFAGLAGSALPAVPALALAGVAFGTMPVFLQAAALRVAPTAPDAASGLTASAFNVGIGGGALLGGAALDAAGVTALPVVAAVLTGAGLIVVAFGRRSAFPAAPCPASAADRPGLGRQEAGAVPKTGE